MTFTKTLLAIIVTAIADLGVLLGYEKFFAKKGVAGALLEMARPDSSLGWNVLTALAVAALTALLFHSLAIPGSRVQRGIYVGVAVGLLGGILASSPWLAKFDAPANLFWEQMPLLFAMGIIGGVFYSLFYWKQKASN